MRPWFHTTIIAATVIATVAVGVASAALTLGAASAPKGDRLPVLASTAGNYVTVEQRGNGVSTLEQVRVD